ncbi:hypothetical protein P280DRAFT_12633 [Massarina eburnea CBS 473.64]|uniref:Uncharacterized protein n=1 Tax=Massarina eburnea CBS 473.64 TaxID=1395130 RepID=A0A6A6SF75_9PLEO|nr:hypothetical protein P280DRAFT_12633 [Massarina eburnea CBS 473.64]
MKSPLFPLIAPSMATVSSTVVYMQLHKKTSTLFRTRKFPIVTHHRFRNRVFEKCAYCSPKQHSRPVNKHNICTCQKHRDPPTNQSQNPKSRIQTQCKKKSLDANNNNNQDDVYTISTYPPSPQFSNPHHTYSFLPKVSFPTNKPPKTTRNDNLQTCSNATNTLLSPLAGFLFNVSRIKCWPGHSILLAYKTPRDFGLLNVETRSVLGIGEASPHSCILA